MQLEKVISLKADYIDVRVISVDSLSVTAKDSKIEEVESCQDFGFGVRVLYNDNWGYAAGNNITDLLNVARYAIKLAKTSGIKKKEKITLAESKTIKDNVKIKSKIPDISEVVEFVLDCEKEAKESRIVSTASHVVNSEIKKIFVNSEGTEIKQEYFRSFLGVSATAKKGSILQESSERSTSFSWNHNLETARIARDRAIRLLTSRKSPSGKLPIIMDPELVGVFLHEALGHMAEADLVLEKQSILKDKINQRIASQIVTIVDDGTAEGYGKIFYDDEGVKAQKTIIVENGVLKSFMHSKQTASFLNSKPTGNSRAQSYDAPSVVRMTNTYIENGKSSFDELIEDIKYGIYLIGSNGGQASPARGIFQFASKEGFLIENGKIKNSIRNAGISGNTLEVLMSISRIGNDFKIKSPGHCGKKGQSVPVDGGGPHILTEALVGGV